MCLGTLAPKLLRVGVAQATLLSRPTVPAWLEPSTLDWKDRKVILQPFYSTTYRDALCRTMHTDARKILAGFFLPDGLNADIPLAFAENTILLNCTEY
jgi:hypothetical protein